MTSSQSDRAAFAGRPQGLVERHLPGGARILVLPTDPSSRHAGAGVVALQLWVLSGTAAERASEHGCAHLLEHMLFKPVTLDSGVTTDIATRIEGVGGDVNAFTSHDETVFHATVPAAATGEAIDALLASIVAPQIDASALARESQVVIEEIRQYRDDPASRLLQEVMAGLFAGHAYERPVLGSEAEVQSHTARRLAAFHARAYRADRVRFIVVGPVRAAAVIKRATPWLSRLPRGRRVAAEGLALPPSRPTVIVSRDDVLEAYVEMAWAAPPLPDPGAGALEVASVVLGYGEAARLAAGTRRRDRVVSDAHASFFGSRYASTFVVTGRMRGRQADDAVAAMLGEIDRLRRVPIDDDELSRAKAVLESDLVYRRETTQGQAHVLGYYLSLAGDLQADRRYYDALSQLTAADVRRACARFLQPSAAAIGCVLPQREVSGPAATKLRRRLQGALKKAKRAKQTHPLAIRERAGVSWVDLPCGVRLRAVVDSRIPVVGGWLVWPGGLRLEDTRRHGATPVMAELLTRGCDAIDGDALAREIDGFAGVLDGFSGRSSAGLHLECVAPNFPVVLRRALQCAVAPTFDEEELDEERRVALADLEAEGDDLGKIAVRDAMARLYVGHPFRLRRRGTTETLGRLTSRGLRAAWRRWYPLSRMVVGLSGDVDLEGAAALIESIVGEHSDSIATHLPQWRGGPPKPRRASEKTIERAKEQAHIALAYPGLALGDRRVPALEVLTAVLGGQAGRLFTKLREDEGLVYNVAASASEGIDAGDVVLYAACGQDKVARAREAMEAEIEAIARKGVTAGELARARAWLSGQYEAALERRGRVASLLAFDEAFGISLGECFAYRKRIDRVSARAVVAVARELLDPSRQIATIVSA